MFILKYLIFLSLTSNIVNTPEILSETQVSAVKPADNEEQKIATTQEEIDLLVLEEVKVLIRKHYETRIQNIKKVQAGEIPNLDSGLWYANQYFEILEQSTHLDSKFEERLQKFKSANYFLHGYASSKSLVQKDGYFNYHLKKGSLPSEVIEDIENALMFIDCAIVFDIAYYRVALKFLGKKRFDAIFGKNNDGRAFFSNAASPRKILSLLSTKKNSRKNPERMGSTFYIANHPAYVFKEKNGESQGFNLISIGKNADGETLYIGLGLNPEGVTAGEVEEVLVSEFNRIPFNQRIVTDEFWKSEGPGGDYLSIMNFLETETIRSVRDQSLWERLARSYGSLKGLAITGEQMEMSLTKGAQDAPIQSVYLDLKKLLAVK